MILVRGASSSRWWRDPGRAGGGAAYRASTKLAQNAALRKLQLARDDPGVMRLDYLVAGGFEERHQPSHCRGFRWRIDGVDGGERSVDVEVEEWLGAGDDGRP